jgi:hypothetical protein
MELTKSELLQIEGGISFSGALINALSRGMSIILEVGRSFGSSLRRSYSGAICPVR